MRSPACSRAQLRRREAGWGAARDEGAVRRMTNSSRPCRAASLRCRGEARTCEEQEADDAEGLGAKAIIGAAGWLETEGSEGRRREAGRPARTASGRAPQGADPRAGVTALVVALKPGNAGGAKGCRK